MKHLSPVYQKTALSYEESVIKMESMVKSELKLEFNHKRHVIMVTDEKFTPLFEFRPPLPFPSFPENNSFHDYLEQINPKPPDYLIILVQAGNAALAWCEAGEIFYHKIIRKYMVRKKQGKAQITYLNQKGKSRAGSRIRLAETVEFFEEINSKLNDWVEELSVEKIIYSCPVRLWGLLFKSRLNPPFEKQDARLIKVPLDVNVPKLEELERVNHFSLIGVITKLKI